MFIQTPFRPGRVGEGLPWRYLRPGLSAASPRSAMLHSGLSATIPNANCTVPLHVIARNEAIPAQDKQTATHSSEIASFLANDAGKTRPQI